MAFMLQFTKVINCFYLVNMILQAIPSISTNAWYYTAIPLSCIIGLGVLKEGLADLKRYQQDTKVNNNPAMKVLPTENSEEFYFTKVKTMDIQVGDILCIHDDEMVPADCILLSTDPSRK